MFGYLNWDRSLTDFETTGHEPGSSQEWFLFVFCFSVLAWEAIWLETLLRWGVLRRMSYWGGGSELILDILYLR